MNEIKVDRRTFASAAALSVMSLAAPALWAQPRLEKTKLSIAVGGKAAFYHLPLTIAEQLGYFKAEGLEVEVSDFAEGARALQAVVGGSADVLSGASEQEAVNLGWAHGALLTTFPGDTTMATVEQVRAFAKGGSARIQR